MRRNASDPKATASTNGRPTTTATSQRGSAVGSLTRPGYFFEGGFGGFASAANVTVVSATT